MSAPRTAAPPERPVSGAGTRGWPTITEALDDVTANRATGALHVEGRLSGSVYLVDGEVYYVHTPAAPGVDCLLQASGTVPPAAFQTAWTAGAAAGQVGEVLIKSGVLSRGEAELCTATAITDGAYALLTASTAETGPARFAVGEGHWWGVLRRIGATALDAQVHQRRRLLERTLPSDVDDQPVVAARRLGRHHVALTDLQWELVVHADGRRTPRELARLLGRSVFSAVLETRRLVAAGLLLSGAGQMTPDPPARSGGPTATGTASAPVPSATASAPTVSAAAVSAAAASAVAAAPAASAVAAAPAAGATSTSAAEEGRTPVAEDRSTPEPDPGAEPAEGWRTGPRPASGRSAPGSRSRRKPELPTRRPDPVHTMPLPRRSPGAALRGVVPVPQRAEARGETSILDVPEPDIRLLSRVRNALEGLR